eukprot:30993-Pelagococcus_subviridis.AAC.15
MLSHSSVTLHPGKTSSRCACAYVSARGHCFSTASLHALTPASTTPRTAGDEYLAYTPPPPPPLADEYPCTIERCASTTASPLSRAMFTVKNVATTARRKTPTAMSDAATMGLTDAISARRIFASAARYARKTRPLVLEDEPSRTTEDEPSALSGPGAMHRRVDDAIATAAAAATNATAASAAIDAVSAQSLDASFHTSNETPTVASHLK